jgi:probable F420-dependent oxidoreductase
MKVGLVLPQAVEDGGASWADILALARQAESGGADSLWLSDHFFFRTPDGVEVGYHEPMILLSALAAATERVELGTLVLATSFRPAGLLAKMTATADDIAGGRLILGLGSGWYEPEYRAFGYPFDRRVARFAEAIEVIARLVRGERVTQAGKWSRADGAIVLPPPRRPATPVMIAATGDRMLRLTANYADSWQTAWYGHPDERFADRHRRLLAACEQEGRDPATMEVTVGVNVRESTGDPAQARGALALDADAIATGLAAWADAGAAHIQIGMSGKTAQTYDVVLEGIRRFRR